MNAWFRAGAVLAGTGLLSLAAWADAGLLLTAEDVTQIRAASPMPARFAAAVEAAEQRIAPFLDTLPDVPVPQDAGGGYTHEQHKRNALTIHEAGIVSRITGSEDAADLARRLLLSYAALYPTLGEHPARKEQSPGRLFWQSLNEAVWLVYAIQGYDAIRDGLPAEDRARIETGLFRPLAEFLSIESPRTFDRIHNHGTWAVAAVGMTGYVLGDELMVEQSLLGLDRSGNSGFIRQLDELFSPDGYYNEGPYYQRYALMPFALFARVIDENDPERDIFGYRDQVLLKAIFATINLSYAGYFFPINDAIKDKDLATAELTYAIPIAFAKTGDAQLLSIVERQRGLVLTGDAFDMARAMDAGLATPFRFKSMQYRDGGDGQRGALSVLRRGDGDSGQALLLKATSQGQGHGHFDRLGWLFFDDGRAIVRDYGAARFLNVEQKNGGHYLPENDAWAKQTVAHNTLVVDETSHFAGDWKQGEQIDTEPLAFDPGPGHQLAAARMTGAYADVGFERALLSLDTRAFQHPVVLDVLKARGEQPHQYDLPLYFQGHLVHSSHPLDTETRQLVPLGEQNGYQFLWQRAAAAIPTGEAHQLTWLTVRRFYTLTQLATQPARLLLTETGANDPEFNLRWEPGLVWRFESSRNATFVSVLEPHGEYDGSREFTTRSASALATLGHVSDGPRDVVRLVNRNGEQILVALSWDDDASRQHQAEAFGERLEWSGFHGVFEK